MAVVLSEQTLAQVDALHRRMPEPRPSREDVCTAVAETGGIERYLLVTPEKAATMVEKWLRWRRQ